MMKKRIISLFILGSVINTFSKPKIDPNQPKNTSDSAFAACAESDAEIIETDSIGCASDLDESDAEIKEIHLFCDLGEEIVRKICVIMLVPFMNLLTMQQIVFVVFHLQEILMNKNFIKCSHKY